MPIKPKLLVSSQKTSATVQCQKCQEKGHWTYECQNERKYLYRPSRTVEMRKDLKRKHLQKVMDAKKSVKSNKDSKRKKTKRKRKQSSSSSDSSSSSSSGDSSSSSDGSSSTGSSSSGSGSSDSSSSDSSSEEETPKKKRKK